MASIFMTGATGQVGAFLAGELLRQGHSLSLLVRGPEASARVEKIFAKIGVSGKKVQVFEGDLFSLPALLHPDIVLHSAAELSFDPAQKEKVWRTNFEGTQNVLRWAQAAGAKSFQYVSTAYVAGQYEGSYTEEDLDLGQSFRNDYEASKVSCEKFCREYCKAKGMGLKIYRPGIIMGTSQGLSLHYQGYYVFLKVMSELCEKYKKEPRPQENIEFIDGKLHLPIRIEANPQGKKHLVPLDHVVKAIAQLLPRIDVPFETVFLLPEKAPTNSETLAWVEEALGVCGFSLVPSLDSASLTRLERLLHHYIHIYRPYLQGEPSFQYEKSQTLLRSLGVVCPTLDTEYLRKLIAYGKKDNWGREEKAGKEGVIRSPYFQEFLPQYLGKPFLSGKITSRFGVSFSEDQKGCWQLTLVDGILQSLQCVKTKENLDFVYSLSQEIFSSIVAGQLDPRHAFFTGKTNISGDVEKGLKVATVLREFFQKNPFFGKEEKHGKPME